MARAVPVKLSAGFFGSEGFSALARSVKSGKVSYFVSPAMLVKSAPLPSGNANSGDGAGEGNVSSSAIEKWENRGTKMVQRMPSSAPWWGPWQGGDSKFAAGFPIASPGAFVRHLHCFEHDDS